MIGDELRLLALAVMQAGDAVMIASSAGHIQFVNPAFERDTGYAAGEAIGRSTNLLNSGHHPPAFFADLWRTIRGGEVFRAVFTNKRKSGEIFHEEKTITPIRDAFGEITHFVATGRDVSERIQCAARLDRLANGDLLTGLPNRNAFIARLLQGLEANRRTGRGSVLLHIDLDRFKIINDTLGHGVGDRVLIEVGRRLQGIMVGEAMVARLGGDEFAVLLADVEDVAAGEQVADELVAAFNRPLEFDGRLLYVNVSIGIAGCVAGSDDVESLMKHADIAMFRAKQSGRATAVRFDAVMEGGMLEDLSMETALHRALDNGEFEIVYQPLVDPASRHTKGVEALLRWHSPQHGTVPPSRFIPILEATGMIVPVGRWVLQNACAHLRAERTLLAAGAVLAVNLSGRQFREAGLIDDVRKALEASGLPAGQLELEITESILIEDAPQAAATLDALKSLGVRLAIDDFGTGYSSLSYLRRFPIDTLKIDRSFVNEVETSADAVVIVRAIINLAHSLGLDVVGEGVESAAQLALLLELGCRRVQGYLFSPPVAFSMLKTVCWLGLAAPSAPIDAEVGNRIVA